MTRSLPKKPNLTLLKKEARKLLKHVRDTADKKKHQNASTFIQQHHPKPEAFSGLRDAQLAVARSYSFRDWLELTHGVELALINLQSLEEQTTAFINLACVQYAGSDNAALYKRANRLLSQNTEIASRDFYAALVANNTDAVAAFLAQNKALAVQTGGPLNWPALLYVTYSRIEDDSKEPQSLKIAQLLLEHGADPDSFVLLNDDTYRFTALTGAMGEGEGGEVHQPSHQYASELVHLLLIAGANPNDSQGLYNTVFANNSIYWLKLLMEYGLNAEHQVNWKQDVKNPSMFDFLLAYAVKHGFEERASFLLEHGASANTIDPYAHRPLYGLALIMGFPSLANKLIEYGAQTETLNLDDQLKEAIANQDLNNIDAIISSHPDLLKNAEFIHHAALRSDPATVLHLISLGFDVNGISGDGRSLLHVYAWEDDVETIKALLDAGADIDFKDRSHQSTPLGHAIYSQASNAIDYLLNRSNNIIEVVCCAHLARLKTLLEMTPDLLHTRTPRGNTLMHIVGVSLDSDFPDQRYSDIIDYLLSLGVDINIRSDEGSTPLDFAKEILNDQIADLFIERGGELSST